jgi:hypothetical protein
MIDCPFCHRPVPDTATVCPHDGCGKWTVATSGEACPTPESLGKRDAYPTGASEDDCPAAEHLGKPDAYPTGPAAGVKRPPPPPKRIVTGSVAPEAMETAAIQPAAAVASTPVESTPAAKIHRPPPPGRVSMAADSKESRDRQSLYDRVRPGKQRNMVMATGVALAIMAAVGCWWIFRTAPGLPTDNTVASDETANAVVPPPHDNGRGGHSKATGDVESGKPVSRNVANRDEAPQSLSNPREPAITLTVETIAKEASEPNRKDLAEAIAPNKPTDLPSEAPIRAKGRSTADRISTKESDGTQTATPARQERDNAAAVAAVKGLYSLRTEKRTEATLRRLGGTPETERAVAGGLDWLARHQSKDGHWGPDCLGHGPGHRCETAKQQECTDGGNPYPMAQTGLALLAFQAGGHNDFNRTKYTSTVCRGLDWIVDNQAPNGELYVLRHYSTTGRPRDKASLIATTATRMFEHGIATFALADACACARAAGDGPNTRYIDSAKKAVALIEALQNSDGGWYYDPGGGHSSEAAVTGWQMLALTAARDAGIEVSEKCISNVQRYFQSREDAVAGVSGYYGPRDDGDAMTAVGMLTHQFLLKAPDALLVKRAAPRLARNAARWQPGPAAVNMGRSYLIKGFTTTNYYEWYHCALAMYQVGGSPWAQWNNCIRDRVVMAQENIGCVRGSWPVNRDLFSREGGGRIFSTSLSVLTLEVYYCYARDVRKTYAPTSERSDESNR